MDHEQIARICHEANKAYCEALGDNTQLHWCGAPEWQKKSAIDGVKNVLEKSLTPKESHQAWLDLKMLDGWRYGPVKCPIKKEHPCFVPYDHLPEAQKLKDKLFVAICQVCS